MTTFARLTALVIAGLLLVACQPSGPLRSFNAGAELAYYDFSRPDNFEQGAYATASLLIRDGVYRIDVREGDNELWWGQWGESYGDVVIDVDAMQASERPENAYGLMCRVRGRVGQPVDVSDLSLDPPPNAAPLVDATTADTTDDSGDEASAEATVDANAAADETAEATEAASDEGTEEAAAEDTLAEDETGDETDDEDAADDSTPEADATDAAGADNTAGTRETSGTNLSGAGDANNGDGYLFLIQGGGSYGIFRARGRDLTPLVNWQTSDAINVGIGAENRLRAVCVGDYLALYVNDRLVAEATDPTYTSGQVGLAASAASRLGARIEFDNLTVSAATPG